MPRLSQFNVGGVDASIGQPFELSARDELRAVVLAQVTRRTVHAHQLRELIEHPCLANTPGYIDYQAFAGALVDNSRTLEYLAVRATVENQIVRPHIMPLLGR